MGTQWAAASSRAFGRAGPGSASPLTCVRRGCGLRAEAGCSLGEFSVIVPGGRGHWWDNGGRAVGHSD